MTAVSALPNPLNGKYKFRSKPVNARSIRVVIPTFKDWDGLRVTVESLKNLKTPPLKITVANDNPDNCSNPPEWIHDYDVELLDYPGNLGPAMARNIAFFLGSSNDKKSLNLVIEAAKKLNSNFKVPIWEVLPQIPVKDLPGLSFSWEGQADWIYFTDCGVEHHPDLFLQFEESWRYWGDSCVAISGPVAGKGDGPINQYMTHQGILNPPRERDISGVYLPQAIITANALIASLPFAFLQGFNLDFTEAAGEDLDMGIRLRQFGVIGWCEKAEVSHEFEECDSDFYKRFRRYGRGNRKLELIHNLPCLRARPFEPDQKHLPEHHRLAKLAVEAMQAGYDEAIEPNDRGILTVLKE